MEVFHILTEVTIVRNDICQIESGIHENAFFRKVKLVLLLV